MQRKILITLLMLTMVFTAGCEEGPRVILAPDYEMDEYAPTAVSDYTPAPSDPKPTPTMPPFSISSTIYTLPSSAMSFQPPLIWEKNTENANYVKFISRDKRAYLKQDMNQRVMTWTRRHLIVTLIMPSMRYTHKASNLLSQKTPGKAGAVLLLPNS